MDETIPEILDDLGSGEEIFLTDDILEDDGGLVVDEGGGDTGDLLDGEGQDGSLIDEALTDGDDKTDDGYVDGGGLIDDGGYSGEDIFVWEGDPGSEDFTDIEIFILEPLLPDDFVFEDTGSDLPEDTPIVEDGSVDGGEVTVGIWFGCVDFPCFPDDAVV